MLRSTRCEVVAIASRELAKARRAASSLGISRAYGSYDELLADPEIDAVYNPLPNHLHVPWTIRAADAGKHVLCEKPLALSAGEARQLVAARDRNGVQIAEAFMVRSHPQWRAVREIMASGRIGELRLTTGHFSYYRVDPADIRSHPEWGGGALMDIGCYPIMLARWLFGAEPVDVAGALENDPRFGVDRLASGLLRFENGHAAFTCGGQLVPYQRFHVFGTTGRIEVEIPYNAPPDRGCRIRIDDGRTLGGSGEIIEIDPADQYLLQAERFGDAIRGDGEVPMTLEDSIANMAVIDALVRSAASRRWERPDDGPSSA